MEITDIRIRKIDTEGKMKAVVSVTFDNEFVIHDVKVIESQNGLFIAMPSRKTLGRGIQGYCPSHQCGCQGKNTKGNS